MTDTREQLISLAASLVDRARQQGADVAEAKASSGWELSAKVRLSKPELVEEAGHKSVALRVIRGQRVALTATSDLSPRGLSLCVEDALSLAELSEADPFAGPADEALVHRGSLPDLDLYDASVETIDTQEALSRASEAEQAALDFDSSLKLSEGASFSRTTSESALVLSSGFVGFSRGSYASLVVSPVAQDENGKRHRGHYWTAFRHLAQLEAAQAVGREAARRTLAKLGSRKIPTDTVPVIFDPDMARSILGTFAGCIVGGALWRRSSYLLEREGQAVASPLVSIVDDPLIPRAPGSKPHDGEGLLARRNVVVEKGILNSFLLDSYSARKLGKQPTASASRSGAAVSASTSNLILHAGTETPEAILASTRRGLYITEMMGFGFNALTGDFSRGAAGFWVEDGKLAFPVSEITISANLDAMLKNIDAVGNDLVLKSSTAAPTFRVSAMTVGGT